MRQLTTSSMFANGTSPSFVTTAPVAACRPRQLMIRSVMYFGCNALRSRACTTEAMSGDTCTFAVDSSPVTVTTASPRLSTVSHGDAGLAETIRFMSLSIIVLPPQPDSTMTAATAHTFLITLNSPRPLRQPPNVPTGRLTDNRHECEDAHSSARNARRDRLSWRVDPWQG